MALDDDALRRMLAANFPGVALPRPVAARLPSLLPRRRLADGRSLFVPGHKPAAFYAVAAGEIETRVTGADGTVSILEHVRPPRLFGLAAFAAGEPAEYEAVARGASEVWVIGREAYTLLMDEVPGFARALLAEFAGRRRLAGGDGDAGGAGAPGPCVAPDRQRAARRRRGGGPGAPRAWPLVVAAGVVTARSCVQDGTLAGRVTSGHRAWRP
jgi:hypothetical protein